MINAQVGIGTTEPAIGTSLHVDDGLGNKGVRLPNANIINLNTVDPLPTGTEIGTMVYNTNEFTGQGHFYWNGFLWAPIQLFADRTAKFNFADAGTNALEDLNTSTAVDVEIMDGVSYNDNPGLFTPVADINGSVNSIRVNRNGRYRITVFISLEQQENLGSSTIQGRLKLTSATDVVRYDGSYHRSSEMDRTGGTRDDDGTLYFTEIIEINENERVSVSCNGLEGTATVYQHDNRDSAFIIEKLR